MTELQVKQFNQMRSALITISKEYETPNQIRKSENAKFMGFEEVIEMAYENIQETARFAVKGVKEINPDSK